MCKNPTPLDVGCIVQDNIKNKRYIKKIKFNLYSFNAPLNLYLIFTSTFLMRQVYPSSKGQTNLVIVQNLYS
ncbi:hypothetical protein CBB_A0205 [Clostridium botulinum Bf]|nr:hypothetical protein CBB_A0205 [Clostridium botulinum Bf]